ncbi:long-chain-fatty-acid--CoA ligase [Arenicella xantha]|uniref:Fatty-acyl-CoA synthase n=1 Tax=Arenicella xantha TaxID=644221 RepID=A0A395JKB4_9GAMM|nr:long-chain-fatty-acid--CoA ligase [Arenicella xantha]RBP50865.1 fatty-acyl-CoA synthase [Arenicella xantha]
MLGLMMDEQLTITALMRHGRAINGDSEIVSVTHDNPRHVYTQAECYDRAGQLANALQQLGVKQGEVVGTLAWNDYRHMEVYYGVACSGSVCHTINPRLFPEQLVYIINHAEDQYLLVDPMFLPLLEAISTSIPNVKGFIVMSDEASMPDTTLESVYCYETLLAEQSADFEWPELNETTACSLCYTSGTTGNPKGVLYSHRSLVLQSYACCLSDGMGLGAHDVALPIVPMFHVNAWNMPYSAALAGFKLIFPGSKMGDGETLHRLISEEGVTYAVGVPTVWLALLTYLKKAGKTVESLQRVGVGGSACPLSIMHDFEQNHGVTTVTGWGMTEMAPLGTFNAPKHPRSHYSDAEYDQLRVRAGRPVFGVSMKIVDENDVEQPWDGVAFGALKVKGPWVVERYFKHDDSALDSQGWFDTGDVASINPDGNMVITDRTKDVIKSGGEWISSIDLENCAVGHEAVAEAAVIGVVHPKWDERPLLIVVKEPGVEVSPQEILDFMDGKVAKWWMPEEVAFVDELPHTATGKIHKMKLRDQFADYRFSDSV